MSDVNICKYHDIKLLTIIYFDVFWVSQVVQDFHQQNDHIGSFSWKDWRFLPCYAPSKQQHSPCFLKDLSLKGDNLQDGSSISKFVHEVELVGTHGGRCFPPPKKKKTIAFLRKSLWTSCHKIWLTRLHLPTGQQKILKFHHHFKITSKFWAHET